MTDVAKALRQAFSLGQTYWQQADSESYSQNRKSDETRVKFEALVAEALAAQEAAAVQAVAAAPVAWRTRYRSEPGMLGHYPWTYTERIRGMRLDQYEYEPLYAALPTGAGEKTS